VFALIGMQKDLLDRVGKSSVEHQNEDGKNFFLQHLRTQMHFFCLVFS